MPKFKVRPVSPDFRVVADWLRCDAPQTWVTLLPAAIHSVTQSTHLSLHCTPASMVAKWKAQGRNSQSEQNGCWLADADLYTKFIWVLNTTLTPHRSLFLGLNLEWVASPSPWDIYDNFMHEIVQKYLTFSFIPLNKNLTQKTIG
jgi:hypothetical protein